MMMQLYVLCKVTQSKAMTVFYVMMQKNFSKHSTSDRLLVLIYSRISALVASITIYWTVVWGPYK